MRDGLPAVVSSDTRVTGAVNSHLNISFLITCFALAVLFCGGTIHANMTQFLSRRRLTTTLLVACLLTLGAGVAHAKKLAPVVTEEEVSRALIGQKQLYLRSCYLDSTLDFNNKGVLRGGGHAGSFSLSGIDIDRVRVTAKEITITGTRVALYWDEQPHAFLRQPLQKEEVHIRINLEGSTREQALEAVHLIFANGYDEMMPSMPVAAQQFFNLNLRMPGDLETKNA